MKKTSSPATNSRSAVKPKPRAEAIDRDVETLPQFRGATQTELRDHMDSNKPVLFIPTEALGVVSDALKKWEAQQMEAKQPSTMRDTCVSGQMADSLRTQPPKTKALLPSMIDRAHDRVSILRDKLQFLHERIAPVLRPSVPPPVNGCSTAEDVTVMPDAVQTVYVLGSRLNELIEQVSDLLDRVET